MKDDGTVKPRVGLFHYHDITIRVYQHSTDGYRSKIKMVLQKNMWICGYVDM